jgi:hypothetical protein
VVVTCAFLRRALVNSIILAGAMSRHPEAEVIAAVNRACRDVTHEQVESIIHYDQISFRPLPEPEDAPANKQVSSIIVHIL